MQVIYEQDDMNFNLDCASQQPSQTLTNYLGEKPSVNNIEHILDQVIEKDEQPPTPEKWAYQLVSHFKLTITNLSSVSNQLLSRIEKKSVKYVNKQYLKQ